MSETAALRGARGIRRETSRSEIPMPSLSNSPWMRGAPHSGFACAICQTRSRVRRSMGGRPGARRERQVQNRRKAERCQRTTWRA